MFLNISGVLNMYILYIVWGNKNKWDFIFIWKYVFWEGVGFKEELCK